LHRARPPFPTRRSSDLMSLTPRTTTPGSCVCGLGRLRRVGSAVSARSSVAPSTPPKLATSRATTDWADIWFSPTAAYSEDTSARSEEHTSELQSRENLV